MENGNIPAPGSKEAIEMGCLCPVVDNNYGKGYCRSPEGEILFCYNANCPVHNVKVNTDESNRWYH